MSAVCPAGHTSTADDYCDVCGMPIQATTESAPAAPAASAPEAPAAADTQACPNCGTANAVDALFCEACGYDFTTGAMPRPEPIPSAPDSALESAEAAEDPDAGTAPEQPDPAEVAATDVPVEGTPAQPAKVAGDSRSVAPNLPFRWVVEMWVDPAWYEAQDSPDPLPSPGLPEIVPLRHTSVLIGRTSTSRNIHPEIDCAADSGVSRRQAQLTSDGSRWFVEDLESANGTFVGAASGKLPEDPITVGSKHELDPDDRVYVGAWTRLVLREATPEELETLA